MAARLVGLQLRQLWHLLTRSVWAIVATVFSGLGALTFLGGLAFLLITLRAFTPEALPPAMVVVGAVAVLIWMLGSLLIQGSHQLTPERFALLPIRAGVLARGLAAASAVGIGGIITIGLLLLSLIAWSVSLGAFLAMLLMLPVALATCILAGRTFSALLARAFASRRTRDFTSILLMIALITMGLWLQFGIMAAFEFGENLEALEQFVNVVATTPFGAALGVPLAVWHGDYGMAAVRLLIALGTVALLLWVWTAQVGARLVNPVQMRGSGTIRGGGMLERLFPATPAGAIAVRSLRYRRRDPRMIINAIMLPFLPVFVMAVWGMNEVLPSNLLPYLALFLPFMLSSVVGMDLAYDHANFATHLITGVSGRDDRAGRALAIAVIAVPASFVLVLGPSAIFGAWDHTVAALALTLSSTLIALGAGSWLGVYLPGRAPKPGASPFGKGSSGGVQALIQMLASVAIIGALLLPTIGLLIGSIFVPWLNWLALLLGTAIGVASLVLGIRLGGKALDKRGPQVLQAVTSES
ncbi:MAG TPA: hypothetical protein H9830_03760 [Candidatus Agrococcus pullicola]|uniref:ABC-2 type transport system permease protein n=1 Tax=Candidatus Agrococcus pullicola TaxID=2838429 RepID=A0A9D2C9I0_9MICO|nr:hypothetical protein [Candidatus Agrococcus pullicola]